MKNIGILIGYLTLVPLFAWFDKLLVNYIFSTNLIQAVFGVSQIGFWRALCISLLTGFLFIDRNTSKD